jgi:hypothetical protein
MDNRAIPADRLIGGEGSGFRIALRTLDHTRITIAAQAPGIAQGALDYAVGYVRERKQFGQPIAEFQGLQFILADMAMDAKITQIYEGTNQIQRMVMARQLLKGLFSPTDLRILEPASRETGRQAYESGGPLSCPGCPVDAGYFPSFPGRVLNRCWPGAGLAAVCGG